MWVFDATPLIYLAKVEQLSLVSQFDASCVIPQRVYTEVVETGIEAGYPDARRIEQRVENNIFTVHSVDDTALFDRLCRNPKLSDADCAVLAYAFEHDGVAVMDETYGRDVAATEGVTTRGTAYLVLSLADQQVIPVATARTVIDEMVAEGWYCSPDIYAKLVQRLDSIAN